MNFYIYSSLLITKNFKGFTLIELLVVISIIGVLSSVVLVSFSGSRGKARLAKAQNFDAQVSHALGAYAVGIWRFEEGSGITLHDESGYGNDGTMGNGACTPGNGSCPSWTIGQGVYSGTNALQFDGSDDYVNCGNDAGLQITGAITMEVWIKINDLSSSHQICGRGKGLETPGNKGYALSYYSGNGKIYFDTYSSSGIRHALNSGSAITDMSWHHIVATWNGTTDTNGKKIYIDGSLSNQRTSTISAIGTPNYNFEIGRNAGGGWSYFNGTIDNVTIYNETLSAMQVQQHYAAGANSHNIAVK